MTNTKLDLKNKNREQLLEMLKVAKKDKEDFVANLLKNKEKNVTKLRQLRKNIARIQTAVNALEEKN
ncbi:50S ribosomal protein L29 [Candidatus Nomurabacteria bacterium]|uniref:50S ribosomal protein L29 n=1 Tax=candidate division WWE3 bacterium TaxID=2053526 RepID=A0A955E154_UNCKA|nr:50S ribosomal protein L29 [candidate division WWE3 bacterium]MCB9823776.1 50S ribosomal protein L29 [Candidatus Nomurabacteria bacterium]MCB9826818.1 50S ribosomal protein L29 [Candidatus Nomurabacteria bacterium]MCB9827571.1 50S ribosomal protein L29 [Candidatus Nomurabacteria bacterium]HXK52980.1 50S ribosomal protein L29 [bacterium]